MRATAGLALLLLTAPALAGCLATDEPGDEEAIQPVDAASGPATDPSSIPPSLSLTGTTCTQGGGHSVHPREVAGLFELADVVPEPWQVADVLEDTGPQVTYSEIPDPMHPVPEEGETWGHYHATLTCEQWTLDGEERSELMLGFVGPKVETPSFATTRADDEYLVTVLATNEEELLERLQAVGIPAMGMSAELVVEQDLVDIRMATDGNGAYRSTYPVQPLGDRPADLTRLWAQGHAGNDTRPPIALDLTTTPGEHLVARGQGYFEHTGTHHHDPLPGARGHTAAVHYTGFDVTIDWGPRPSVSLDEVYDH